MSCGSDFHSTENHNDIIVQINDKLEQEIVDWQYLGKWRLARTNDSGFHVAASER